MTMMWRDPTMKTTRNLVIALTCVAAAASGCATLPPTTADAPTTGASASPTTTSPASPPLNVFYPETPHDFGSEGQ